MANLHNEGQVYNIISASTHLQKYTFNLYVMSLYVSITDLHETDYQITRLFIKTVSCNHQTTILKDNDILFCH